VVGWDWGLAKECESTRGYGKAGQVPAWFVAGGCHWGELGGDGEDAVEFAIGEGGGYGGGRAGEDSEVGQ